MPTGTYGGVSGWGREVLAYSIAATLLHCELESAEHPPVGFDSDEGGI